MKECEAKLNVQKWMKWIFSVNNKRGLLRAWQDVESAEQFHHLLDAGEMTDIALGAAKIISIRSKTRGREYSVPF